MMRDATLAIILCSLVCLFTGFIVGALVATAAEAPLSYSQPVCPKEFE